MKTCGPPVRGVSSAEAMVNVVVPERLNQLHVDTRWGYRSFEVWHGDITKLDFVVNLLLIAQPGVYPTYSLHKSLHSELGISVHGLKQTQELDFVQPLGVWVSRRTGSDRIHRILCMQLVPDSTADQKIREAFFVLPILLARGIDLETICLPVLGAGGIGLKSEDVAKPIVDASYWALSNIEQIKRICFVDIARDKVLAMSGAMDEVLGRVKLTLAKGADADRIRLAVSNAIDNATAIDPNIQNIASDIRAAMRPEGRSVQVGNAGRQLSEYVLGQLLPEAARKTLFYRIEHAIPLTSSDQIDNLKTSPTATWMNGYFHLLRLFGNETSHHENSTRVPHVIEDKDLILILLAIERVLRFWVAWRTHQASSAT